MNETNLWLLGLSVFFFLLGYFINRQKQKVVGHFALGRGRVISETRERLILKCGCTVFIATASPKLHLQQFTLDYKRCKDHTHDENCRK